MTFIQANNRKQLNRKLDNGVYPRYEKCVKVDGGYACFESFNDYYTWKKQK